MGPIDLHIGKGEIVGLAGLVGAGKTELCRAMFGASPTSSGEMYLNGRKLRVQSPLQAVRSKMALVPEERRREGVFVEASVVVNLTAASLSNLTSWGSWLSARKDS